MKTLKNREGFTLIELLAVIVVLAVVIAIGTTAVLPMVTNIRKGAFVNEANIFVDTASNILNIYDAGGIEEPTTMNGDYQKGTHKYCFSLKYLVDVGLIDKDPSYFSGEEPEYAGKIIVDTTSDGTTGRYTYTISMHNNLYNISSVSGTVEAKDVTDYEKNGDYACASSDVE